jgi:DNA-binding transcriptional LysR family regulator
MVAFASAGLACAMLTPNVVGVADFPVSLVPMADVEPITTLAMWRRNERDPVVRSAIDMVRSHAAGIDETRTA